jgi:hypothetical protein
MKIEIKALYDILRFQLPASVLATAKTALEIEMRYYIYTLDVETKKITAALSFSSEAEAEEAYWIAYRKMGGDNVGVFRFGYTSKSQVTAQNEWDVNFNGAEIELEIDFLSLPGPRYPKGMETHRCFKMSKFEEAEQRTKKILATSRRRYQRDIQFMRHVESVMTGSIASETENVTSSKSTSQPLKKKENRNEVHGKKMVAVQFAIENPGVRIGIIEQNYELKKKSLSRKPYVGMIKEGKKITRNQSGRKTVSKEDKTEFYHHKKLEGDASRSKKR